jgi:hypothetical protein
MIRIVVLAVVIAAIAVAAWLFWPGPPPPPPASPAPVAKPAPAGPLHPIPDAEPAAAPLPKLGERDATLLEALSGLFGGAAAQLFITEDAVRHIVATIDNLPREAYAARLNPVQPPRGVLGTTGRDATLAIAPANAARYRPYVSAFEALDAERAVRTYVRLYPLFQQAYVELGYPNGYFNDRLVEVIDHLLDAPEPKEPLKLTVPHVLYEFADPDLEALSSGQKVMVRIGAQNAARVKAKLREIRQALMAQAPSR